MVGNDDLRAVFLRVGDLRRVGDAAVHRDDELGHKFIEDGIERSHAHTVPLAAFGNVEIGLDAEFLERAGKHGKRADAVRVIVAEQRHPPSLVARLRQELRRLLHALHQKGREQMPCARMQEGTHLFRRRHAPRIENARRGGRDAQRCGASPCLFLLGRGELKFMHEFFHVRPVP